MKSPLIIAAACLIAGCGTLPTGTGNPAHLPWDEQRAANMMLAKPMFEESVSNAIIVQRTLFDYHFVPAKAQLTELGERDLTVLAGYFKETGGQLNVRRAGASDGLYGARIEGVVRFLAAAGVEPGSLSVADSHAGGEGMPSLRFVLINLQFDESGGAQAQGGGSGGIL